MTARPLRHPMHPLRNRSRLTILVTDSGLGGLSIGAAIAARLKVQPLAPRVSLIYYNAWPAPNRGYNRLAGDERIRVFDQALAGMVRYAPDLILIACNTLSVLYPRTQFAARTSIPVMDIITGGVEMVKSHLRASPRDLALILGTVTTIASRTHVARLTAEGIDPQRLFSQPCDQLATQIEKGPAGAGATALVTRYMGAAAQQVAHRSRDVAAALCCTHFGYCQDLIQGQLAHQLPGRRVTILNPNRAMVADLFDGVSGPSQGIARITVRMVSKIRIETRRIAAIGRVLAAVSPETAAALKSYEYLPDLFTF